MPETISISQNDLIFDYNQINFGKGYIIIVLNYQEPCENHQKKWTKTPFMFFTNNIKDVFVHIIKNIELYPEFMKLPSLRDKIQSKKITYNLKNQSNNEYSILNDLDQKGYEDIFLIYKDLRQQEHQILSISEDEYTKQLQYKKQPQYNKHMVKYVSIECTDIISNSMYSIELLVEYSGYMLYSLD